MKQSITLTKGEQETIPDNESMIGFIILICSYTCMTVGVYNIAKKLEIPYPWISFIPVINCYILGQAATFGVDNKLVKMVVIYIFCIINVLNWVVSLFFFNFGVLGLASLLLAFLTIITQLYYLFKISKNLKANPILSTVLAIFGLGSFVYLYLGLKVDMTY